MSDGEILIGKGLRENREREIIECGQLWRILTIVGVKKWEVVAGGRRWGAIRGFSVDTAGCLFAHEKDSVASQEKKLM